MNARKTERKEEELTKPVTDSKGGDRRRLLSLACLTCGLGNT